MRRVFYALCLVLLATFANAQVVNKDTFVVAQDGSGDFKTIQECVEAIRAFRPNPTTVHIKNGVYKEKVVIHTWICGVQFIGEDRDKTIITWGDYASLNNMGTFRTYSLLVQGNDLTFENLTIENNAPEKGQAVAAHLEGDRMVFRNCRIIGNQDTIYTGREGARIYFDKCYIEGTTDYIFGGSVCWFEECVLHCKRNSYITAASTPENQPYGYVFNRCKVTVADGVNSMYLGRPWRAYAMTLFMNSELPAQIKPEGWDNWRDAANEKTTRYMEYNNIGEGANLEKRVAWSNKLTAKQAKAYTLEKVMQGWKP